jgi:transcriptional regulator with XRE-family HTH domain
MIKRKTKNAVTILHNRYVKDDPERKAALAAEHVHAEVARMIYDLRKNAGLSQQELAKLVDTTQSVISRLEDADYDGHSLSMLQRIAEALEQKITVEMTAKDPDVGTVREAFHKFVQMLRRGKGLTLERLAKQVGIDCGELSALERNPNYRPTPLVIHKLSKFYKVPERRMLVLAGAVKQVPEDLVEQASRFAAQSDSFARLTSEEKKALDQFIAFLRTETVR